MTKKIQKELIPDPVVETIRAECSAFFQSFNASLAGILESFFHDYACVHACKTHNTELSLQYWFFFIYFRSAFFVLTLRFSFIFFQIFLEKDQGNPGRNIGAKNLSAGADGEMRIPECRYSD